MAPSLRISIKTPLATEKLPFRKAHIVEQFGQPFEIDVEQNLTAIDIVKAIFRKHGFTDFQDSSLTRNYRKRDYCVQYRESDFNFVQRLMEEEGISREVQSSKHVLPDYDFTKPRAALKTQHVVKRNSARSDFEVFDCPGQ